MPSTRATAVAPHGFSPAILKRYTGCGVHQLCYCMNGERSLLVLSVRYRAARRKRRARPRHTKYILQCVRAMPVEINRPMTPHSVRPDRVVSAASERAPAGSLMTPKRCVSSGPKGFVFGARLHLLSLFCVSYVFLPLRPSSTLIYLPLQRVSSSLFRHYRCHSCIGALRTPELH